MARYLTRGMVVLSDDHAGSSAALFTASAYTPRTVVVCAAGHPDVPAAQMVHPKGGASIDAAFRCAAEDMIPWVAMRRDYAPPESVLSQVLESTGRRTGKDLPGFCVLLAGDQPRPIGRILVVLDRADGQPSGLLILAAVATAQATGAELDVLLIGAEGESMSTPANVHEAVSVSRDKDLYDQALRRATEGGIRATWIAAEDVDDTPALVLAQVADGNYDLVIDDLGSVSLGGRIGRGGRIARAVAPEGPAAVVRALLEQTDLPLAIVLDGVRLGLIPPAVLKGGAGTILALGLIASAAPAATASASELSAQQQTVSQSADAYEAALNEAADLASPAAVDAALTGEEEAASEEAPTEGAPAVDAAAVEEVEAAAGEEVEEQGTDEQVAEEQVAEADGGSDDAAEDDSASADAEAADDSTDLSQVAPAELAPEEVAPEAAPEVDAEDVSVDEDVEAEDVDKVEKSADETADDLKAAEKEFDKAQDAAIEATEEVDEAAAAAEEAAAEVAATEAAYQAVATDTSAVVADATGVSGGLPGGATAEDLATAEAAQEAAVAEIESVGAAADEALAAYNAAALDAAAAQVDLDEAAAAVTEADAAHQEASATADATEDAYQEVMADARLTPVAGASVSTHYGASGSVWSTGHHTGVDYAAPEGTEVVAAASGTVVEVGYDGAYGNRIVIEHEDGYYTTYNHLSDTDVEVGQEVTAGDHIGEVGNTGNSFGSHLHFEVTKGGDGWSSGSFVDPEVWLEGG